MPCYCSNIFITHISSSKRTVFRVTKRVKGDQLHSFGILTLFTEARERGEDPRQSRRRRHDDDDDEDDDDDDNDIDDDKRERRRRHRKSKEKEREKDYDDKSDEDRDRRSLRLLEEGR